MQFFHDNSGVQQVADTKYSLGIIQTYGDWAIYHTLEQTVGHQGNEK